VCVVTGANSGIGLEAARGLARLGAHVVMACRSRERGEQARAAIAASTSTANVELMIVDLASQASIRDFARALATAHPVLHVLVNNAGIWSQAKKRSVDGIELTWATNVLGYFLTTELLLPALRAGAPSRIVNVASMFAHDLDVGDVQFDRRPYSGPTAYAQSKQANRLWTWALARRLEGTGITANAMHPGGVNTPLFRKAGGLVGHGISAWARVFAKSPEAGADTVTWLASSSDVANRSGRFWIDRKEAPCAFRDTQTEEALWSLCASMIDGRSHEAVRA
jgi:NAD(P)-dependent dehydrogenase (short-subunit alcohol dehydrogenase family)